MIDVGREAILLIGYSTAVLGGLDGVVPEGSVVVVEEPDIVRKRAVRDSLADAPEVSRLVEYRYVDADILGLLEEPGVRTAQAVVPGVEYAVVAAAEAADSLGVRGAGVTAARIFRDKSEQRAAAARAGLRELEHSVVGDVEEAVAFLEATPGHACVLKPTAWQASLGVRIVRTAAELRAAWAAVGEGDRSPVAPDRGVASRMLVERAVSGPEHSVELLMADGRVRFANVTLKRVQPGPSPVEAGHVVPAPIPRDQQAALLEQTRSLAGEAGFGSGVLHAEWIVDTDGPVLIECAARVPGDQIPRLISLAYDFGFIEAYLCCLLGEDRAFPHEATGGSAIRFLTAAPGEVVAVSDIEDVRSRPHVIDALLRAGVGAHTSVAASSWDRVGFVLAAADNPLAAEAAAVDACRAIHIDVRD